MDSVPKQTDEELGQLSRVVVSIPCLQGQSGFHSTLQQVPYLEATCPVLARCSAFLVFEVVGFFIEADFGLRPYCILIIYYKTKQIKIPTLLKNPHKFLCLLFFLMNSVLVNWACISFYMGVLLWKDLK